VLRLRIELIAVIFSVLLGAVSVWLGTYDPLWTMLGLSNDLRGSLTIALSLFVLLTGFLITYYLQQSAVLNRLAELGEQLPLVLREEINKQPQVDVLGVFNGDQAHRLLCRRLETAKVILNTRITMGTTVYSITSNSLETWERSLRTAIRSGAVYREIVSDGWQELARERVSSLAGSKGLYEACWIPYSLPAILNFTMLQHTDGTKEVWFGWIMSPTQGVDQVCFRSTERRMVQMFENWHAALFACGTTILATSSRSAENLDNRELL
jgi:hypothetical protein